MLVYPNDSFLNHFQIRQCLTVYERSAVDSLLESHVVDRAVALRLRNQKSEYKDQELGQAHALRLRVEYNNMNAQSDNNLSLGIRC